MLKPVNVIKKLDDAMYKYDGVGREYDVFRLNNNVKQIYNLEIYDKYGKTIKFIPKYIKYDMRTSIDPPLDNKLWYIYMYNSGRRGASLVKSTIKKRFTINCPKPCKNAKIIFTPFR